MDGRVLVFALAISVATGLLFGLAPAWQATSPELTGIDEGRRPRIDRSAPRASVCATCLIVAEVALAFILLVGSGLMMRSFFRLLNVDTGFDSTNVLTIGLPIDDRAVPRSRPVEPVSPRDPHGRRSGPGRARNRVSCAPPMQGSCYGMPMQVAGRPIVDRANRQGGFYKVVSPSYFTALGLRMRRGRALSDRDTKSAPPALVINERLAKREFPDQDPIGQRMLIQEIVPGKTELGPEIAWEIVGVVHDEKVNGIADERSAGVYVSNEQSPVYFMTLSVRARTSTRSPLQKSITRPSAASTRTRRSSTSAPSIRSRSCRWRPTGCSPRCSGIFGDRGAAARGHRHLRRDLVFGRAAHA